MEEAVRWFSGEAHRLVSFLFLLFCWQDGVVGADGTLTYTPCTVTFFDDEVELAREMAEIAAAEVSFEEQRWADVGCLYQVQEALGQADRVVSAAAGTSEAAALGSVHFSAADAEEPEADSELGRQIREFFLSEYKVSTAQSDRTESKADEV